MEATCNCGAIRVKVNDDDLFTQRRGHLCHCINCRKTAGSVFSSNLLIETSKVVISGEENLSVYEDRNTSSGNPVYRYFCKTCGNPIKSLATSRPGKTILKLGIFPQIPTPELECFVKDRLTWLSSEEGRSLLSGTVQYVDKIGGEKC